MKVEISKQAIKGLLKDLVRKDSVRNYENFGHVRDILVSNMDESVIESIITLMLMEEVYRPLAVGDYCRLTPPSYHTGDKYEPDVLEDLGLLHKSGDVYGVVLADTSWTKKTFDPFHHRLKVNLLYHDTDKQLKCYEDTFSPFDLKKMPKGSIKYFKNNKDAKIITGADPIPF